VIRVGDPESIPQSAKYLSQALDAANIPYRIAALDLQFPIPPDFEAELVIGTNA